MSLLATALLTFVPAAQDPITLDSRIRDVTVYGASALVTRTARVETASGRYLITGLPWSLDPANVRVRADGADVIGIELGERHVPAAPDERLGELRARMRGLERELRALQDENGLLDQVSAHLGRLLAVDEKEHGRDVREGRANAEAWAANLKFLASELASTKTQLRENAWKTEEVSASMDDLRRELAALPSQAGIDVRELLVDLVGAPGAAASLEIEYVVQNAGWQPLYDLRAARDGKSVELGYRAQVWQQSGEDWSDVELALSTSEPLRGAQGPDPRPLWLRIIDPRPPASARLAADDGEVSTRKLGYLEERADRAAAGPRPFAEVESQGLSARFRLARRETIESRQQPTTVLIGQSRLAASPEYFAVPSLDTSVWLRGRTLNTSPWILLPGRASVYFGADFIGHASLALVQPKQEFTLHLGADPALKVERIQKENLSEGAGVFSSNATRTETWLVRLQNNGAAAVLADGRAVVHLREAMPRTTDERLEFELVRASAKSSQLERWKKDLTEQGIHTWVLEVPRNGTAELTYTTRVTFPEGMQVAAR